jgi:hypothetical protein
MTVWITIGISVCALCLTALGLVAKAIAAISRLNETVRLLEQYLTRQDKQIEQQEVATTQNTQAIQGIQLLHTLRGCADAPLKSAG